MNGVNKILTAAILTAALLFAGSSSAMSLQQPAAAQPPPVTLRVFESARHDQARQSQLLNTALEKAFAKTLVGLRDTHFKDGKEKTPQRIERDLARAIRVEKIAAHPTDKQSGDLINMIAEYADAQPDTTLEDVITSFLLTEADKPPASAPGK